MKPQWVLEKERIRNQPTEEIILVGELGVSGVIDGKLPNGESYEWTKRRDKMKKSRFKRK